MKVWLSLPALRPGPELVAYARVAQETGLEGVAIGEHVVVPEQISTSYPYSGKPALIPLGSQFPDPLILLASLGATFADLKLMTNVLIAPLRHPIDLARQTATVAALTGGRLELGVGAGWMREEFDALAIPFERRGERLDEILELLSELWAGEFVHHAGDFYDFPSVGLPTPPCRIPLYVGGTTEVALRRAARSADGWVGLGLRGDDLAAVVDRLAGLVVAEERSRPPLRIRTVLKGRAGPEQIDELARIGVESVVVQGWQVTSRGPFDELDIAEVADGLAGLARLAERRGAGVA
ncbi:TIGR03619 family F420-dependent LLM class oxidoreductase [Cryptosporangium sp. NPDC051539]|uniref:TIGR03619 family F420-dependent LLM class oxidoreductase n=1 Tax=Cryptosporangium sp. NPDC051539 TaxID=3363962 RepID=UPI0037AE72F1